jgi:RNA polymerase-associated protein CTR9
MESAERVLEVPLAGQDDQTLEIDLEQLPDDPTELCEILENESAKREYWIRLAVGDMLRELMSV